MLKMTIASVKDNAAQAFLQPFFSANSATAQRSFADALNDSNSIIAAHPSDHDLYEIATFDSISGTIEPLSTPRLIVRAKDLIPHSAGSGSDPQLFGDVQQDPKHLRLKK